MFRLGLLEVLRTTPRVNPSRVQIIKFGDYLKMLKPPLAVNTIRLHPLRGFSVIIIDPNVVFSSLDSFFGGFGKGVGDLPPGRMFTPTESRIINIILDVFFRSLKEAWAPVTEIDCEKVSAEINPQFAQIADENDLVVLNRFEADATANGGKGFMDLVYPYATLKPLRELLRNRVQTGDGNEESDKIWRNQLADAVKDAELEMNILLGKLQISLSQLQQMQAGDVLYFKKADHARAMIRDLPVYDVEVGTMGSQTAVKIVEAISPTQHATH
jgi:flagellar motor switch protein FliM